MSDLSKSICNIEGVLGASVVDRGGVVISQCYQSDTAQGIITTMTPYILDTMKRCEVHDPHLHHLRIRFKELMLFIRGHKTNFIITVCKSDLFFYLLDSSIESLIKDTMLPALPSQSIPPPGSISEQALPVEGSYFSPVSPASSLYDNYKNSNDDSDQKIIIYEPGDSSTTFERPRQPIVTTGQSEIPSALTASGSHDSGVYQKVLSLAIPYFRSETAAERFIQRQVRDRMKTDPGKLNFSQIDELAEKVTKIGSLSIGKQKAIELGNKIRKVK